MHLFIGLTLVYYWWNSSDGKGDAVVPQTHTLKHTHFHLSVCSANTVDVWAASPFFMSPEWFSPEKQSALLEQSEPLSTQWQTRGWDIQVLPLNLVHPNISGFLVLILETRRFLRDNLQPLNRNRPPRIWKPSVMTGVLDSKCQQSHIHNTTHRTVQCREDKE